MAKEFKEKTITVNLRKVFEKPVTKRAISAKNMLKKAVEKDTRLKDISISNKVNEEIWGRGKYWAPRKMTIKIINEKGRAIVLMPSEKYEPKQDKKKKEETTKKEEGKKETTKETKTVEKEVKQKETKTENAKKAPAVKETSTTESKK